jgi:hypothetical protein
LLDDRERLCFELTSALKSARDSEKELECMKKSMELYRKTSEQLLDEMSDDRDALKSSTLAKLPKLESNYPRVQGSLVKCLGGAGRILHKMMRMVGGRGLGVYSFLFNFPYFSL